MRWAAASKGREPVTPALSKGGRSPDLGRRKNLNNRVLSEKAKQRIKEEERVFGNVAGLF